MSAERAIAGGAFGRLAVLLLSLLAGGTVAPGSAMAQGRFEEISEAEKVFQEGLRIEEEAAALQRREGMKEPAQRLYERALEHYRRSIRLDQRSLKAYAKAGYVLYIVDRPTEAIELLQKARTIDTKDPDIEHILGINYFKKRDFQSAIPLLKNIVQKNPDLYYGASFLLGKYYYDHGNYQFSIEYFQKYLQIKPDDHNVHGVLGNIYLKQKKFTEALQEFRRVLELNPDDLPAQINVGNIQYQQGSYVEAARLFEKVLTRDPKKASIHYNLASAFFQLKRYADATRMYRSFLALRPTSHAGHFYLGQALAIQDDLAGAEREYEQARRLQPDHPATAYRLGLVLANLGRWEQARAMLERAVAQKSDDPWPRAQLANLKRRQGELEAAAAIHQQLAQQHPENQHFQLFYGESLLALGKLGEAEARFFAALRLQPGSKAAQHGQALLLCHRAREAMAAGDVAQARLLLTQSRGLAPASRPVQEGLALLQAREATPELRVEALATLTRLAREPGGISPGIAVARAELLALLGRAKEAEQALQQVQGAAATGSGSGSAGAGQGAGSGAKTGQGAGSGARTGQGAAAGARPGKETHERRVQHARALLLAAQGELDQAIRELEQLSQPPGAAAEVLRNLARLQVRRAGELLGKGKAAPARTLLLRAEKSADTLPPPQARQMRKLLVLSFLELREYPRALEGIKTLRKQNARDRPLLAELDYLEAYGHYRLGQNDRAWGLLQRHPELKQPGRVAELGRQLLHRQAALHLRRRRAQPSGQLLQQARALPGGESDVLRHDLALVDYFGGNKAAAAEKLGQQVQRGQVPEAELNLGIVLDERGEKKRAYELYRSCAARGGEHAAQARQLAEAKERVFGFGASAKP